MYLNVFEYFMFWNAFFVLGGKGVSEQRARVRVEGSTSVHVHQGEAIYIAGA